MKCINWYSFSNEHTHILLCECLAHGLASTDKAVCFPKWIESRYKTRLFNIIIGKTTGHTKRVSIPTHGRKFGLSLSLIMPEKTHTHFGCYLFTWLDVWFVTNKTYVTDNG